MKKPIKTFAVYKIVNGRRVFWMYARGKSPEQVVNSIVFRNRKVARASLAAVETQFE